ncbi:hypothetical protein [Streptomyces sp. NPDC051636]|uniref:hypothetical protein n=1 Tax=Streptomyces sp. NPDC051636 TaxID=3365663 RepID=UPI0037B083B6
MRLNQYPADSGGSAGPLGPTGGKKDLASSPAEKQAAARALENHIEPDTKKAGAWADDDTAAAVKAFQAKDGEGWLTSGAIKAAHKTWGDQVQNLLLRLSSEKAALRGTSTLLQGTDLGVGSGVRATSSLDGF